MDRTRRNRWLGWAAFGALVVGGIVSFPAIKRFATSDPLVGYRDLNPQGRAGEKTVFLDNVDFVQYNGDKLIIKGKVGKVAMTRERDIVDLSTIRNGEYLGTPSAPVGFEAGSGTWNDLRKLLTIRDNVRVFTKDYDLRAADAVFESGKELLRISGKISGRFFDGTLKAASVLVHLPTKSYQIGPVEWVGLLAAQDGTDSKTRKQWTIKANGATKGAADLEVWTQAEATDGEIIVRADRIERNSKTDVLVATGNVRYFGKDANMTCNKATVYRKQKRAILEGDITMLSKAEGDDKLEPLPIEPLRPIVPESIAASRPTAGPTPVDKELDQEVRSSKNRKKYPVRIYAQKIDYIYAKGQRRAVITGNPQARQELSGGRWRAAWANSAIYDRERETLEMRSGGSNKVRIKTSLGDDLISTWFKVSTREGDDSYEAKNLEGQIAVDEDEDEGTAAPPPQEDPDAPPPGP